MFGCGHSKTRVGRDGKRECAVCYDEHTRWIRREISEHTLDAVEYMSLPVEERMRACHGEDE